MAFTLTTLVENSVPKARGVIAEHGLSFFIEAGGRRVVFDTGQGFALVQNAEALGVDLSSVEAVVLSHGHYDHSGGLNALLEVNREFTLYAHPGAFDEKFSKRNGQVRSIGPPISRQALEAKGIRMVLEPGPLEIVPGVTTSGEIPGVTDFEVVDPALFTRQGETLVPDPVKDDLSLILNAPNGVAVLLGCAHRGVINILTQVQSISGKRRLLALAGGLHLGGVSEAVLKRTLEALGRFSPELLVPGHCTGFPAILALYGAFKDRVRLNQVGYVLRI